MPATRAGSFLDLGAIVHHIAVLSAGLLQLGEVVVVGPHSDERHSLLRHAASAVTRRWLHAHNRDSACDAGEAQQRITRGRGSRCEAMVGNRLSLSERMPSGPRAWPSSPVQYR